MPRKKTGRKPGGQPGNGNALKTGEHTAKARCRRVEARVMIAKAKALVALVHSTPGLTSVVVTRPDQR
jgi:hypothetical protein